MELPDVCFFARVNLTVFCTRSAHSSQVKIQELIQRKMAERKRDIFIVKKIIAIFSPRKLKVVCFI